MGLGFLWYVTKVLLLQLKIKWAGLLFLCRGKKSPSVTPPLPPSDSPERTSVGAPDLYPHPPSSTHSSLSLLLNLSLHLRLQCNSSWGAKVLLLWCLQIRVHSFFLFFFFDHQHRSQMKDCTTGRLQNQTRDRSSFIG